MICNFEQLLVMGSVTLARVSGKGGEYVQPVLSFENIHCHKLIHALNHTAPVINDFSSKRK